MKRPNSFKIGTRGSRLALAQTQEIVAALQTRHPQISIQPVTLQTSGDRFRGKRLAEAGGKGLFVKEIEEALLKGEIDFAVHSLKDLPGVLPEGLTLACFPKREDPRDCFISLRRKNFASLPQGALIGTGSPRRTVQILSRRPDLRVEPIRGNVDTRLRKLAEENFDGLILAAAGLKRLRKEAVITEYFSPDFLVPAIGQGILAIETRAKEKELAQFLLEALGDETATTSALAERAFLQTVGGDCYTPMAAHAWLEKGELKMTGWLASPDSKKSLRREAQGEPKAPETLGKKLAKEILDAFALNQAP